MKTAIVSFILLTILPNPSFAQALSSLPEPDKDPFVGTWKPNADKSHLKLNKLEASVLKTISRDGDEVIFSSRFKIPSSEYSGNHYGIRCDGLPHRVLCGLVPCTGSCTYVAANRVEGHTKDPDGKTRYWTREVSSDSQEMREVVYKDKARTTVNTTLVYDRVK